MRKIGQRETQIGGWQIDHPKSAVFAFLDYWRERLFSGAGSGRRKVGKPQMRVKCRLGIHKWVNTSEIWTVGSHFVVLTYNNCQEPECRYETPILVDVEKRKRPPVGILS